MSLRCFPSKVISCHFDPRSFYGFLRQLGGPFPSGRCLWCVLFHNDLPLLPLFFCRSFLPPSVLGIEPPSMSSASLYVGQYIPPPRPVSWTAVSELISPVRSPWSLLLAESIFCPAFRLVVFVFAVDFLYTFCTDFYSLPVQL